MKLQKYNKYIISRIVAPVLLISFTLTGIIWLSQSLRFIDLIINQGIGAGTFLYISSLLLPSLLWVILPIALFVGVIYVYNKMIADSELVALENSGVSRVALARPAVILAVLTTIFSYLISFYLLPVSYREFKDMQNFIRNNYASILLQEGVFNTPAKGLTVYIRERNNQGLFKGMLVHDNRNPAKPITMMATEGHLIKTDAGPKFNLIDGNRQEIDYSKNQVYLLNFDSYSVSLSDFQTIAKQRWREPEERFLPELLYPEDTLPHLLPKLTSHAHYRITWPLYNIALALIAVAATLPREFNRRQQKKGIIAGCLFSIVFIAMGIALNNIVAKNPDLIFLMYINVGIGTATGLYFLLQKDKRKKSTWQKG